MRVLFITSVLFLIISLEGYRAHAVDTAFNEDSARATDIQAVEAALVSDVYVVLLRRHLLPVSHRSICRPAFTAQANTTAAFILYLRTYAKDYSQVRFLRTRR